MAQAQDPPQAFPAAEQANVDPLVFQTAQPLTNNEVQLLLSKWGAQCREADPTWVESPGVKDVQKYLTAVSGSTGANLIPEVFGRIRQRCESFGLASWETCMLVNLLPNTPEAAFAYIPALKARYNDEEMRTLLNDLEAYSQRF